MATNTHRAGGIRGLLAWQWEGYARYHQSRVNLLLHVLLVPLFLATRLDRGRLRDGLHGGIDGLAGARSPG
jgi:hypothetical protein